MSLSLKYYSKSWIGQSEYMRWFSMKYVFPIRPRKKKNYFHLKIDEVLSSSIWCQFCQRNLKDLQLNAMKATTITLKQITEKVCFLEVNFNDSCFEAKSQFCSLSYMLLKQRQTVHNYCLQFIKDILIP